MTLAELQQMRARLAKEMRDYNDAQGDAEWGAEQREKWAQMRTDIQKLDDQIQREEEVRSAEQMYLENNPEQRHEKGSEEETRSEAFTKFLRHGLGALSPEQRALAKHDEQRALAAGIDEQGGYTVPKEFIAKVYESMAAYGGIASVARILYTDRGNAIQWPTSKGVSEEGELVGENKASSEQDVTFGMATLGSHKMSSKIIRVSNELIHDSGINIDAFIANRVGSRNGRGESRLIVQGTGKGTVLQPSGLEVSATVGANAFAADKFTWKDVNALIHSVDPAYRNAPKFRLAFNDNTLQLIEEMEDDKKRPLWIPGLTEGAPGLILGRQYVVDQAISSIGAEKKFMFAGDFDQFIIRRVNYMSLRRLTERYADFDQTGFLGFHRFGCVLQDLDAIKSMQGKAA